MRRLTYILNPFEGVHNVVLLLRTPLRWLTQDLSSVHFGLRLAGDVTKDADTLVRNARRSVGLTDGAQDRTSSHASRAHLSWRKAQLERCSQPPHNTILLLDKVVLETIRIIKTADNEGFADGLPCVLSVHDRILHHGTDLLDSECEDVPDDLFGKMISTVPC